MLTLEEPETYEQADTDELSLRKTTSIVRDALSQRNLRAFILYYYVLYAAVSYLVFIFLQPVFEVVVVDLGVSPDRVESLLGWFYGAYSVVGAVLILTDKRMYTRRTRITPFDGANGGSLVSRFYLISSTSISYYTGSIREHLGIRLWFLVLPFAVGSALVGMYYVPVLALPTFLLARGLSDVTRSFAGQYVNDRVETLGRATVLSAMAMVSGLAVIPFQLGSGLISDAVSPLFALAIAGLVLVVGSGLILLWEVPVSDRTPT